MLTTPPQVQYMVSIFFQKGKQLSLILVFDLPKYHFNKNFGTHTPLSKCMNASRSSLDCCSFQSSLLSAKFVGRPPQCSNAQEGAVVVVGGGGGGASKAAAAALALAWPR